MVLWVIAEANASSATHSIKRSQTALQASTPALGNPLILR
jgi:hypothetical protein